MKQPHVIAYWAESEGNNKAGPEQGSRAWWARHVGDHCVERYEDIRHFACPRQRADTLGQYGGRHTVAHIHRCTAPQRFKLTLTGYGVAVNQS